MNRRPEVCHLEARLPRRVKEWGIATVLFAAAYAVIYALMSIPQ